MKEPAEKKITPPKPGSKEAQLAAMRADRIKDMEYDPKTGFGIPPMLQAPDTDEARKRLDLIRAAAKRVRANPARAIKNPPNRIGKPTGLGMSPTELKTTGATVKAADTEETTTMKTKSKTTAKRAATKSKGPAKSKKPASRKKGALSAMAAKVVTTVRPGSKAEVIAGLLTRAGGCTLADIKKATGWKAVSVPRQATDAGLELAKTKRDGVTVYSATPAA